MKQLKILINNNWFFPIIILYYGIFYILHGDRTVMNNGLGVDGLVYAEIAKGNFNSELINSYTVTRIFPAYLVHLIMKLLSLSYTNASIISTFKALDLILLVLSVYYLKKIFVFLKINLKIQILSFVLFIFNVAVLKFSLNCSVGTDTDAVFLGLMLVYFYLTNNQIGLFIISLMAAFTWPFIAYQGIVMFLFPVDTSTDYPTINTNYFTLIRCASILFALFFLTYYVFYKNEDLDFVGCLKINKKLLYMSCFIVLFIFYHFSAPFLNGQLYYKVIKHFRSKSFFLRILIIGVTFATVEYAYKQLIMDTTPSQFLSLERTLKLSFLFSVVRPGFSIVSHFAFFGALPIFLILFWTSFSKSLSSYGPGMVLGFTMYLYLMGIMCETRLMIPLLSFFVIFLAKAINGFKFSNMFYFLTGILSIIVSKVWLTIDYKRISGLDKNGCLEMPDQLLLMNFGPWMSQQMYYVHGAAMLLFAIILFFALYKIEIVQNKKILLTRKF